VVLSYDEKLEVIYAVFIKCSLKVLVVMMAVFQAGFMLDKPEVDVGALADVSLAIGRVAYAIYTAYLHTLFYHGIMKSQAKSQTIFLAL